MTYGFYMPVNVIGGKDAVSQHKEELALLGKSCLIVCGQNSAQLSGALADVTKALDELEIKYTVFDEITQNPKTSDCHRAGQVARDYFSEFIIGIGGGSQLDAAKAVAVYASNKHLEPDDIYTEAMMLPPLPVVLVGTTAGTGSEVTGVSVLTKEDGKKKSVSGKAYYAKIAYADPSYTYSVPYEFTVSTAIDAFSHATESLFSNKCNGVSEMYAKKAIPELWKGIKFFYENQAVPTDKMRDNLYYASIIAGMALNLTGTCYPHTLGYKLTEDFGMPHGFACAAFLPSFVKRALEFKSELAMEYLSALGVSTIEFEKIINSLVDLSEIKMTEEQIDSYCEGWQSVKNFTNSPAGFSALEAKKLLSDMFLTE